MTQDHARSLRILHVLRAPLGGLFRHVLDLTREQVARGHQVGLVADSRTGGPQADAILAALEPSLALGLTRTPMRRSMHPSDAVALADVMQRVRACKPDVVHGHGSKGGAFARLAVSLLGGQSAITAYTPHGGSFNYRPGTLAHALYMSAERFLASRTDIFLFESAYVQARFHESASPRRFREKIVLNGVERSEFARVEPAPGAADFLYVGELRSAKGIDTMLEALAVVAGEGRAPSAVLVGSGPDEQMLKDHAARLGLQPRISFPGRMPARRAFAQGRVLVVPSRAESLPYVVLEAAAAQLPMIATDVGGIPEIFGPYADQLIACDDVPRLAARMSQAMAAPCGELRARAAELAEFVHVHFTISAMVDAVIAGYREALAAEAPAKAGAASPASIPS